MAMFSLALEGNGRMQSGKLTRQFDSNRTLIFIADAAGFAFDRVIIGSWKSPAFFFSNGIPCAQL